MAKKNLNEVTNEYAYLFVDELLAAFGMRKRKPAPEGQAQDFSAVKSVTLEWRIAGQDVTFKARVAYDSEEPKTIVERSLRAAAILENDEWEKFLIDPADLYKTKISISQAVEQFHELFEGQEKKIRNGPVHISKTASAQHPAEYFDFAREHLLYEVRMFVIAREAVVRTAPKTFEMNVFLEACVLHFRNLFDFFYTKPRLDDDVTALNFVPGWPNKRPRKTQLLERAQERANKEMAHLTKKRIAGVPEHKAWDFGAISADLRTAVNAFLSALEPGVMPQSVIDELGKI